MIFIFGPLFGGKTAFAIERIGCREEEICRNVQDMVRADMTEKELTALAEKLTEWRVVIATEVGGGVVPMEQEERICRELAGRLNCLLAERAETVVRVFCGLPLVLKGRL